MVAVTLPSDVVRGLRKVHRDLAWAIVTLFEKRPAPQSARGDADAELVDIARRQSLIAVNRAIVRSLPGVDIIPLNGTSAFLALAPGQGISELELAVRDRLENGAQGAERRALTLLRAQLRKYRHDKQVRVVSRAIIIVEHVARRRQSSDTSGSKDRHEYPPAGRVHRADRRHRLQ